MSDSKKPSHHAYNVKGEGDKSRWIEIGAAWPHADNKGFNIEIDALPISGRIVLRVNEPKPKAE